MIEIPEAAVLAEQINEILLGKVIHSVIVNHSPHKLAWFAGDPQNYESLLSGKTVTKALAFGGILEIQLEDVRISLSDGVALKYHHVKEKLPKRHQLLIEFEDSSVITATVQMYGGICCFNEGDYDNKYYLIAKKKPSPLTKDFSSDYFKELVENESMQNKSAKAFLATEQRIPGLGNGVLQDILYNAKIHPKRKVKTFSQKEQETLYDSIKSTLLEITLKGGRDTEKDLFGSPGGYKTKLSKKTLGKNCNLCGDHIVKKAYMGGSIYYCEGCQQE